MSNATGLTPSAVVRALNDEGYRVKDTWTLNQYYAKTALSLEIKRGTDPNRTRFYSEADVARIKLYLLGRMLTAAAKAAGDFDVRPVNKIRSIAVKAGLLLPAPSLMFNKSGGEGDDKRLKRS